tara:strand:- start:590 stop:796 length:207 start_codon:yes stop_codon:yes gene_type:complete
MEIILVILIYGGFGYVLYKVAKSKNREPFIWILIGLVLSPVIVLIILALMPSVQHKKKSKRKKTKNKR